MGSAAIEITSLRRWVKVTFSRSPKPGGQNVNKVNTRVTLLFDFEECDQLSEGQRRKIRKRFSTRLSRDGRLQIIRHRERTQSRNRRAAEVQLQTLLGDVMVDEKVRKATRPTLASRKRRIDNKRRQGLLKKQRKAGSEE